MRSYVVLVPVKSPAVGKSRLVGLPDHVRREHAAAFALDTVTACLQTPVVRAVLAVTDDVAFAARLTEVGCTAIPDGVVEDLNASLRQAAEEAHLRWPDLVPVALCADLPALRPVDLAEALNSVPTRGSAFVPDSAGLGTTLYTAPHVGFDPRFGPGSRELHLRFGALEIGLALPSLRQDVDDLADLAGALALGVGTHTAGLSTPG